jgi:hypothetical protein
VKTVKTHVEGDRLSAEIDILEGLDVPDSLKPRLFDQVGEYVVEQVLADLSDQRSPVTGRAFKALSEEYAKEKGQDEADLDASGGMIRQLDWVINGDRLEIGVFGEAALRADGHNNLSGKSKLPERRFIPDVGQTFRPEIREGVRQVIHDVLAEHANDQFKREDLAQVQSRTELYEFLGDRFPGMSVFAIKAAVLRNESLVDVLTDLGLMELL